MFRELDTVALAVDLPASRLARGHVGTVVLPPDTFEVEFTLDDDEQTSVVTTLRAEQLVSL